jgi:hypothetical protein
LLIITGGLLESTAAAIGEHRVLQKPFRPNELIAAIGDLLAS